MYELIFYTTRRGDSPVEDYIETLPDRVQSKIATVLSLLKQHGPNLTRPYADIVRGKIRELRIRFAKNQYRILYFFFRRNLIVLTHAFLKNTQKLSERDIQQAEHKMQDFIERYEKGEIR